MKLLTRCKILDVALVLHCLQIIFSLKSPSPTLKRHMDLTSSPDFWITGLLFDLNYELVTTLLALAKSIYYVSLNKDCNMTPV